MTWIPDDERRARELLRTPGVDHVTREFASLFAAALGEIERLKGESEGYRDNEVRVRSNLRTAEARVKELESELAAKDHATAAIRMFRDAVHESARNDGWAEAERLRLLMRGEAKAYRLSEDRVTALESECERLRARVAVLELRLACEESSHTQTIAKDDARIATLEAALRQVRDRIERESQRVPIDIGVLNDIDAALGEAKP